MAGIIEGSRAEAGPSGRTRIRPGKIRQRRDICMYYPLNSSKQCLIDRTGRIKTAEKKVSTTGPATALLPVGAAKGTTYKHERVIRGADDRIKLIQFSLDEKLHQEK